MFNPTCLFAGSRDGEESSEVARNPMGCDENQKVFEVILKGAGY